MATLITKNSSTASSVPTAAQLVQGELAVNVTDKRLFTENSSGTVVELGTNPSSLTLPNGTVNGLAFLNASKVLTTGSALTFDGSNLSTVQSDGYNGLRITNTSGKIRMSGYVNGTLGSYIDSLNAAESAYTLLTMNGNPLVYQINGTEQMRLTSTGLGIGTSSPAVKLHVNAGAAGVQALFSYGTGTPTIAIGNSTTTYNTQIGYNVNSEYGYIQAVAAAGVYDDIAINPNGGNVGIGTSSPGYKLDVRQSSDGTIGYFRRIGGTVNPAIKIIANETGNTVGFDTDYSTSSPAYTFSTGGTERMRLDSSGNLGLGVTPSAWNSSYKALQFGTTGTLYSTNSAAIANNMYVNSGGTSTYITTAAASVYLQNSGAHQWFTAPSGTAGNAISFTQAMTLDASGNLLVGTTSSAGLGAKIQAKAASSGTALETFDSAGNQLCAFRDNGFAYIPPAYNKTTASAANMFVGSSGDLYRSTSALKYKQDIRDLEDIDIDRFRPVRYKSKCEGDDPAIDHFGVIADEVDTAGIKELVNYGANGEVEGFQYERLTVVLLKEIQSLRKRLAAAGIA